MKEKTKISAQVVADSIDSRGNRLTSMLVVMPRIIIAEMNTHRMLSKNTSSSRAIPFEKMVEAVQNDPFIPIAWQKHHSGMQGNEYFTEECMIVNENKPVKISKRRNLHYLAANQFRPLLQSWHTSRVNAIKTATELYKMGVTKQLCNRLLEPFMWTTMLITGSKEGWDNFFSLRCPDYVFHDDKDEYHFKSKKDVIKHFGESEWVEDEFDKPLKNLTELDWLKLNKGQAEIHMMTLSEKIYDVIQESVPRKLKEWEWHIPMIEIIED